MPNEIEKIMRICDWVNLFENNRTKELKRLDWVPIPNRMDGDAYTELLDDHPNGAAHLGVWLALVLIASRCDPRGTLLRESRTRLRESRTCLRDGDEGTAHTSQSLARMSHLPAGLIDEAIPRLIKIGWVELIDREHGTSEIPHLPAGLSHLPAGLSHLPATSLRPSRARAERKGTERNGREANGTEDRRPPSVETPGSDPATELPPLPFQNEDDPPTVPWMQSALHDYVKACRGPCSSWEEPDEDICRKVIAEAPGKSTGDVMRWLKIMYVGGEKPDRSYAWFVTKAKARYAPRPKKGLTQVGSIQLPVEAAGQ
jgi:hypothetical protein